MKELKGTGESPLITLDWADIFEVNMIFISQYINKFTYTRSPNIRKQQKKLIDEHNGNTFIYVLSIGK